MAWDCTCPLDQGVVESYSQPFEEGVSLTEFLLLSMNDDIESFDTHTSIFLKQYGSKRITI